MCVRYGVQTKHKTLGVLVLAVKFSDVFCVENTRRVNNRRTCACHVPVQRGRPVPQQAMQRVWCWDLEDSELFDNKTQYLGVPVLPLKFITCFQCGV